MEAAFCIIRSNAPGLKLNFHDSEPHLDIPKPRMAHKITPARMAHKITHKKNKETCTSESSLASAVSHIKSACVR